MPYKEALVFKTERAKALICKLMEVHYTHRDDTRVCDVFEAIKHTNNLLKELEC